MTKRMSDEIFQIYGDGGERWLYGRADQYATKEEFVAGAKKHWEEDTDESFEPFNVKKQLVRIGVLSPEDQEGLGYRYTINDVFQKGPGVWESWILEVQMG